MDEFNVGDTIRVKGTTSFDSPKMTVYAIGENGDVWVTWFQEGQWQRTHFPPAALVIDLT